MEIGETIAYIVTLLLAVYGCAQLLRQLCLWLVRCPRCAACYRLAIPRRAAALEPLLRCLQAKAVWGEGEELWLVLPEDWQQRLPSDLLEQTGCVKPVTLSWVMSALEKELQDYQ